MSTGKRRQHVSPGAARTSRHGQRAVRPEDRCGRPHVRTVHRPSDKQVRRLAEDSECDRGPEACRADPRRAAGSHHLRRATPSSADLEPPFRAGRQTARDTPAPAGRATSLAGRGETRAASLRRRRPEDVLLLEGRRRGADRQRVRRPAALLLRRTGHGWRATPARYAGDSIRLHPEPQPRPRPGGIALLGQRRRQRPASPGSALSTGEEIREAVPIKGRSRAGPWNMPASICPAVPMTSRARHRISLRC